MRCPTLSELPPPPAGKTGWPWTEASPCLKEVTPDNRPWPLVTVVTPSYNQGRFLEETIRSVLLQGYPDLEYIILDGGSNDESVDVTRKYERWLTAWVSEPDGGQSEALNRGFRMAQGETIGWLNSDDTYLPGAIQAAVEFLEFHPEVALVYGFCPYVNEDGGQIGMYPTQEFDLNNLCSVDFIAQPASFFRSRALSDVGFLDETLQYAMDYDLWLRMALRGHCLALLSKPLAVYRVWETSKSVSCRLPSQRELHVVLGRFQLEYQRFSHDKQQLLRKGFACSHVVRAYLYYEEFILSEARRHWLKAIRSYPSIVLTRPNLVACYAKSVLGKKALTWFRSQYRSTLNPTRCK